jgi:ATP-dependent Lhr-like helicase
VLRALWASQEDIVEGLKTLANVNLEDIVRKQMLGSGIFKKNFVNAAKKFGAISKEANLTDISINRLIEAMKDTAVVEEAYRSAIRSDTDLEDSKTVLAMIDRNELQVQVVKGETLTPVSRIGIEELSRRAEIVPPEKLRHIIAQVVRARLLEEAFILVCTNCWKYSETFRVKQILHGISCPICSSKKVGVSQEEEERVKRLISRMRSGAEKPPISLRRTYKKIIDSSRLIEKYGGTATFVLAERSLAASDADSILEKHSALSDELVQAIIDASRKKIKRKFS